MLVKFGDWTLEITGHKFDHEDNEEDVQYFLNNVACAYREAAKYEKSQGYVAIPLEMLAISNSIYEQLDALGFYNSVRGC